MAPTSTNHLAKAAPEELGGDAGEEDVVRVFRDTTERADTSTRAIALADLHSRRDPTANPLPHEDANLQGNADGPHHREGEGGGGRGNGQVHRLGGELPRRLQTPAHKVWTPIH